MRMLKQRVCSGMFPPSFKYMHIQTLSNHKETIKRDAFNYTWSYLERGGQIKPCDIKIACILYILTLLQ